MGAWIEIVAFNPADKAKPSLPSWERGLKLAEGMQDGMVKGVAPFVGAWIEISDLSPHPPKCGVAPFVGAWIEIALIRLICSP